MQAIQPKYITANYVMLLRFLFLCFPRVMILVPYSVLVQYCFVCSIGPVLSSTPVLKQPPILFTFESASQYT